MENYESVSLKVVAVAYLGFDWKNFGVLDRWSFKGGGRLQEMVVYEIFQL